MTIISNMVMPKIEREAEARNYGKFVISPLERGYGATLGNSLRRVLLSSLDGAAITSIRAACQSLPAFFASMTVRIARAIADGLLDYCSGQVLNVDGGFHQRTL